jgi:hypothetical protein
MGIARLKRVRLNERGG